MSDMHSTPDRVVWFDLPVAFRFAVLEHGPDGNGGCLIPNGKEASAVVRQAEKHGGKVLKALEGIGPHGFRASVLDSEGNRIALHSNTDK